MIRANLESITGKPWTTDDDAMAWFMPYKGANADPALAARFRALAELPARTFGHAFATFYRSQQIRVSRRGGGAQYRVRGAAQFLARARRL